MHGMRSGNNFRRAGSVCICYFGHLVFIILYIIHSCLPVPINFLFQPKEVSHKMFLIIIIAHLVHYRS